MPERRIDSRRAFEGRLLSVRVDEVELDNGRHATREVVEHRGAVGILAWDERRLAMVSQWRTAAAAELLEIPAGTMDAGETPSTTAERELAEECGLSASSWEAGPSFFTAPGFCTERLTIFLATGLRPTPTTPPEDELLESSWLTLPQALVAIDEGRIIDAKSLVGILWLARRLEAAKG
jgi:ADP-ribose pyrophosphatase